MGVFGSAAGGAIGSVAGRILGGMLPFKKGGKVPGKKGAPRRILAHGGEVIVPNTLPLVQKMAMQEIKSHKHMLKLQKEAKKSKK